MDAQKMDILLFVPAIIFIPVQITIFYIVVFKMDMGAEQYLWTRMNILIFDILLILIPLIISVVLYSLAVKKRKKTSIRLFQWFFAVSGLITMGYESFYPILSYFSGHGLNPWYKYLDICGGLVLVSAALI
jgi:hypothetical protein